MTITDEAAKEIFDHLKIVEECTEAVTGIRESVKVLKEQLAQAQVDLLATLRRARDGQTALFTPARKETE